MELWRMWRTPLSATTAFEAQMFQYTDATGKTATTYNATTAPFGPYIKGRSAARKSLRGRCYEYDVAVRRDRDRHNKSMGLKRAADGTTGWKYLPKLGVIFANDEVSAADDDKPHKQY